MTDPLPSEAAPATRVLVMAPTGRDAANTWAVLGQAQIRSKMCRDIPELCRDIEAGAGTVLLTEEALSHASTRQLETLLARQEPWSDLPFIFLTRGGPSSPAGERAMAQLGNVILLERPVRVSTLVTAVRTALRGRTRQYQIRDLLEKLRDADRRKDEFLAMLAHELRNPLAPVRNAADVLKAISEGQSKIHHIADIIDRQVSSLARLVDDLLDVSRITRGKIALDKGRCEIAELVERAVETSRPLIDDHGHRLAVELPNEPVFLECDAVRIVQVLSNLLNNAAKYTPRQGQIRLRAHKEGNVLAVCVSDTGIGIPAEMLDKIFDLFTQVDTSVTRARGGLGIGLTLARSIVELHGGNIAVSSKGTGKGSEFTIRLPLGATASGNQPAEPRRANG